MALDVPVQLLPVAAAATADQHQVHLGKRPKRLLRGRKIPQRQQKRQDKPNRAAQG